MRLLVPSLAAFTLSFALTARADERALFSLDLSAANDARVRYGLVRAVLEGERRLVVETHDVSPALVTLIDGFVRGQAIRRDVRLTSGAVLRKTDGARLAALRLPAIGSGGAADVELAFTMPVPLTTHPQLSTKEAAAPPAGARISAFRIEVSGMTAIEAPKLDAIVVTQKPDGSATAGDVAFEVAAGGAPPFVAWQKANAAKPAPRALRVEYVGADGLAIVKLRLDRCTPSRVLPLGASGTTRITLTCGAVRND